MVLASELLALASGEVSEDDSHAITPEPMKGTLGCLVMRGPRVVPSAEPGSAGSRAILAEAARDALRQGVGFLRRP